MDQKSSVTIINSLLALLCGSVLTGVFLLLLRSLLLVTVAPLFLSLMIGLLLALFVLFVAVCLVLGFLWFLLLYNDERHRRSYLRERRDRDLEEREHSANTRRGRFMQSSSHMALSQPQTFPRHSKPPRFNY